MDQELILQALKSACGNKIFRFQVIVQDDQLHIYINRKAESKPDYDFLTDLIIEAIASLKLNSLDSIWLYSRKLGETEADWQTFVELSPTNNTDYLDTLANSQNLENTSDNSTNNNKNDTGLLHNIGMVHSQPLPEESINIFTAELIETNESVANSQEFTESQFFSNSGFYQDSLSESIKKSLDDAGLLNNTDKANEQPHQEEVINTSVNQLPEAEVTTVNNVDENSLDLPQYCFITNKKLLTGEIIPPDKDIIRLVKFFHHLSENNKKKILPALDTYFQSGKIPSIDKLSVGVKKWFQQVTELSYDDGRTVALWLSRYCFDSTATIAEFKTIAEKQAELADAAKKAKRSQTEYSYTFPDINLANSFSDNEQSDKLHFRKLKISLPETVKKFILPLVWTAVTVILLILGIYTNAGDNSAQIPSLCKNTVGSPAYCRLAVNLAGSSNIKQLSQSMFPLTKTTAQAATFGCQRYANLKAGITDKLNPQQTPVISSHGEKVFPHIYVVEVQQKNFQQPGYVKVGCVYTVGQSERSPKLLAADVIPLNWSSKPYQKPTKSQSNLAFGIYTHFINLGLYTIFNTIGIAIVSRLNLGIKIKNSQTIYLLALFLGILQLIAGELPVLSLIAHIIFSAVAILAASLWFKNVQINWSFGYSVSVGILTIIAIQFLLYGLCLKLINILV
jgi:hypothetical protein